MRRTVIFPAGTIKRIHVDRRVVAQNRKYGKNKPSLTIQTYRGPMKARKIVIHGTITFDQAAPQLRCGARIYGVTRAQVTAR